MTKYCECGNDDPVAFTPIVRYGARAYGSYRPAGGFIGWRCDWCLALQTIPMAQSSGLAAIRANVGSKTGRRAGGNHATN